MLLNVYFPLHTYDHVHQFYHIDTVKNLLKESVKLEKTFGIF